MVSQPLLSPRLPVAPDVASFDVLRGERMRNAGTDAAQVELAASPASVMMDRIHFDHCRKLANQPSEKTFTARRLLLGSLQRNGEEV
jgi:hypothetical protein